MIPVRAHAVFVKDEYLAGEYIALEFCADRGESAALGRHDIGAVERFAVAQRAEAVGVARREQLCGGHEHEGICALKPAHRTAQRVFYRRTVEARLRDNIGDYLGGGRRVEDSAAELKLAAQFICVAEVSVVGKSHLALLMIDLDGLAVRSAVAAGRAVARVGDSHPALRELHQVVAREDFVDKSDVLARSEHSVVVNDYAAALLPSVLQGIETVIGEIRHGAGLG